MEDADLICLQRGYFKISICYFSTLLDSMVCTRSKLVHTFSRISLMYIHIHGNCCFIVEPGLKIMHIGLFEFWFMAGYMTFPSKEAKITLWVVKR